MEKIYTIPVNEAFEASMADPSLGCPMCALYRGLEEREIDLILGASMMEPDVRIRTNRHGFCAHHFRGMFAERNRLGLALMLESHLAEVADHLSPGRGGKPDAALRYMTELDGDCYICRRIEDAFAKMTALVSFLWETDPAFRKKLEGQPYICLHHERDVLAAASHRMKGKTYVAFSRALADLRDKYLTALREDVSWFCKKFDYRYDEEPWYNSKDAVERAIKFLSGAKGKGGAL